MIIKENFLSITFLRRLVLVIFFLISLYYFGEIENNVRVNTSIQRSEDTPIRYEDSRRELYISELQSTRLNSAKLPLRVVQVLLLLELLTPLTSKLIGKIKMSKKV